MKKALWILGMVVWAGLAQAVEPSEVLSDPVLEDRARSISQGLRCLQCRNESIDESNAGIAKDLRILVRRRLVEGDSDTEIRITSWPAMVNMFCYVPTALVLI